jgi:hypothetical protein
MNFGNLLSSPSPAPYNTLHFVGFTLVNLVTHS